MSISRRVGAGVLPPFSVPAAGPGAGWGRELPGQPRRAHGQTLQGGGGVAGKAHRLLACGVGSGEGEGQGVCARALRMQGRSELWPPDSSIKLEFTSLQTDTRGVPWWSCCLVAKSCPALCNSVDCVAHQAPLPMGFFRQEYWSGLPFPSPRDLLDPGIEPGSPAL